MSCPAPNSLVDLQNRELLNSWLKEIKPEAIVLSGGNNIGDFQAETKPKIH